MRILNDEPKMSRQITGTLSQSPQRSVKKMNQTMFQEPSVSIRPRTTNLQSKIVQNRGSSLPSASNFPARNDGVSQSLTNLNCEAGIAQTM